jgi:hypothetical protein
MPLTTDVPPLPLGCQTSASRASQGVLASASWRRPPASQDHTVAHPERLAGVINCGHDITTVNLDLMTATIGRGSSRWAPLA